MATTTIASLVKGHAQNTPHKCAVTDGQIEITYQLLEWSSNRFARYLLDLGCQHGDRVVILANKQALLLVGMLGVFKARAIHVPLDPRMPVGRLEYILKDIRPRVVLTEEEFLPAIQEHVPSGAKILLIDELDAVLTETKQKRNGVDTSPGGLPRVQNDDVAYCIYTSGSTGRPKGVMIKHKSIIDFFVGTREFYDVDADSRCASFSPLHFDVFLMDMLFPLYQGAWLYLYSDIAVPDLLFQILEECSITHFSAWGIMLGLIAQAERFDEAPLPSLKTVLTGTEIPDVKTVQRWLQKNRGVKVINAYGPTEATCAATAHVIEEIEPDRRELYPIGKAFKHVKFFLVKDGEVISEPNVPGELLIGGSQVMKGYWNLDHETSAKLVHFNGMTCYQTGDICKYLPDGSVFYIGRKDNEVKIRGYRVHLNEVQCVINSVQNIYSSEVVAIESKYGEKVLAAGILLQGCAAAEKDCQRALISARLANELPSYMIPRYIAILDRFPQLSSGKTDRKALSSILEKTFHNP